MSRSQSAGPRGRPRQRVPQYFVGFSSHLVGRRPMRTARPRRRRNSVSIAVRNLPALFSVSVRHPVKNPMRIPLPILLLACAGAHAAIIQGTVVEAQTGRPLARTLVVASPVAGTAGAGKSVRTNVYGTFELEGLTAGAYIVTASRRAFATPQYGQKQWKSAGLTVG